MNKMQRAGMTRREVLGGAAAGLTAGMIGGTARAASGQPMHLYT